MPDSPEPVLPPVESPEATDCGETDAAPDAAAVGPITVPFDWNPAELAEPGETWSVVGLENCSTCPFCPPPPCCPDGTGRPDPVLIDLEGTESYVFDLADVQSYSQSAPLEYLLVRPGRYRLVASDPGLDRPAFMDAVFVRGRFDCLDHLDPANPGTTSNTYWSHASHGDPGSFDNDEPTFQVMSASNRCTRFFLSWTRGFFGSYDDFGLTGTFTIQRDDLPAAVPPPPWWVTEHKTLVQQHDPPVDWLGGPHPTEFAAAYWRDRVGPAARCVEWHDHAGDPAAPATLPTPTPPDTFVELSALPATVGPAYVECLTDTEIAAKLAGSTAVQVKDPMTGVVRTEHWNCPPRYPDPWPFASPTREQAGEDPPRLRRAVVGEEYWYTEVAEFVTEDRGPSHTPPEERLLVTATPIAWHGGEPRRAAVQKCRQNCPPCHRRRTCVVVDPVTGFPVTIPDVEDKGTDWRAELQAVPADFDGMYHYASLCQWICSNECNKARFNVLCDPSHPDYVGCADRELVAQALSVLSAAYGQDVPPLAAASRAADPPSPAPAPAAKVAEARRRVAARIELGTACVHRGEKTGGYRSCRTCAGTVLAAEYACAKHGTCVLSVLPDGDRVRVCSLCPDRSATP